MQKNLITKSGSQQSQTSPSSNKQSPHSSGENMNDHQISNELLERMRKRKCFADKELEVICDTDIHPLIVQSNFIEQTRLKEKYEKEKEAQINQNLKLFEFYSALLEQSVSAVASQSPSPSPSPTALHSLNFIDKLNLFKSYYQHINANNHYNQQLQMYHQPFAFLAAAAAAAAGAGAPPSRNGSWTSNQENCSISMNEVKSERSSISQEEDYSPSSLNSNKFKRLTIETSSNEVISNNENNTRLSNKTSGNNKAKTNFSVEALLGVVK